VGKLDALERRVAIVAEATNHPVIERAGF